MRSPRSPCFPLLSLCFGYASLMLSHRLSYTFAMRPYALVCLPIGSTMLSLCCSHAFPMLPLSSSCASHALLCFCIALPIFLCYFVWTKIATPAFEYCRRAFCECPAIQKPRGNLHGLADGLWVSCRSPPYAFPTLFSTFFCDASPCFHDAYPLLFLCLPYTLFLGFPPSLLSLRDM